MKQILIFLAFVLFFHSAYSQTVLLEEDVRLLDIRKPRFGQNMANFGHMYVDFGMPVVQSEGEGAEIRYAFSHSFSTGYRYKRKLADFLAVGADIAYLYLVYDLKQNNLKRTPDNVLHDKEKFRMNTAYGDVFFRVNFGKRGNIIGKFIDIGAYTHWSFSTKHLTIDKLDESNQTLGAKEIKVVHRGLNYVNDTNYGFSARIGFNRYVLFGMYRMSDFFTESFKKNVADVELPRLLVGLQIGLHK